MTSSASDRQDLFRAIEGAHGSHVAAILMDHLPHGGWDQLATKDDLALTTAVLRTELADVRTDLRTEMADLRTDLRTEMADLRTEMADVRREIHSTARQNLLATLAMNVALVGAVVGLAR